MKKYEDEKLREKVAKLCHEQWSGWMKYLFSKSETNSGKVIIPKWAVERWTRQMETSYSKLTDEEKESDREEADKFIKLFENYEG